MSSPSTSISQSEISRSDHVLNVRDLTIGGGTLVLSLIFLTLAVISAALSFLPLSTWPFSGALLIVGSFSAFIGTVILLVSLFYLIRSVIKNTPHNSLASCFRGIRNAN